MTISLTRFAHDIASGALHVIDLTQTLPPELPDLPDFSAPVHVDTIAPAHFIGPAAVVAQAGVEVGANPDGLLTIVQA